MIAIHRSVSLSVSLSVTRLNSAARAVCAGTCGAAFAKSLRPLVCICTYHVHWWIKTSRPIWTFTLGELRRIRSTMKTNYSAVDYCDRRQARTSVSQSVCLSRGKLFLLIPTDDATLMRPLLRYISHFSLIRLPILLGETEASKQAAVCYTGLPSSTSIDSCMILISICPYNSIAIAVYDVMPCRKNSLRSTRIGEKLLGTIIHAGKVTNDDVNVDGHCVFAEAGWSVLRINPALHRAACFS